MDQKDLFAFFLNLRDEKSEEEIYELFENYDINKLDINRIYRYLDKNYDIETDDGIDSDIDISTNI
jgi:hypothetical protein